MIIKINACNCERCRHVWLPRGWNIKPDLDNNMPVICPRCKSPYWNKKKKVTKFEKHKQKIIEYNKKVNSVSKPSMFENNWKQDDEYYTDEEIERWNQYI